MENNKQQFNETLDVVKYLGGVCGYYEPLERAFEELLNNTQFVDITELKKTIGTLEEELNNSKVESSKQKETFDEVSLQKDKEIQELQKIISNLGQELSRGKLEDIKNKQLISELGQKLSKATADLEPIQKSLNTTTEKQ